MIAPPPSDDSPLIIKIVVIGSSWVGKTTLIRAYITGSFEALVEETVQLAISTKTTYIGNRLVELHISDTAGQEKYQSLVPNFYRNAQGALIVFDVTSPDSFKNVRYWINELSATMPDSFIICIVGNKIDLEQARRVTAEEGRLFASENGAFYQETSALTGSGVGEPFQRIAEKVIETEQGQEPMIFPIDPPKPAATTRTCCR
jgi:Ras-related protein Rab-5C